MTEKRRQWKIIASIIAALAIVVSLGACSPDLPSNGAGPESQSAAASGSLQSASNGQQGNPAYKFRSKSQLKEHYKKHGKPMGYESAQDYLAGANAVIGNANSLHKKQRGDGDDVYYLQATDEIVIVSPDGYIRTYFNPGGIDYYNRQ